jgi:hypothetical protein
MAEQTVVQKNERINFLDKGRSKLSDAGYTLTKITEHYRSGPTCRATKDGVEIGIESYLSSFKVSVGYRNEHHCPMKRLVAVCDELVRHENAIESILENDDA